MSAAGPRPPGRPKAAAIAPPLLERARADQVATLYGSWHRTTGSMLLGAFILCVVLWDQESPLVMGTWFAAILANQAWRGWLARAYRLAAPPAVDAPRWGNRWAAGSTIAGALWGLAAIAMFPASPPHQALLIVCVFSVVLGGLNLTAVYKPSFYGFALAALLPLIARVALEGGNVHAFTALVLFVVLVFVLGFGYRVNELITHSLAMRYENVDLIGELTAQTSAAESARAAAETADRAKSQFLAAASHDLRQPLHAMGLFAAALAARARDPEVKPLVASIHASVEALENLFAQLLDLSRLDAGALRPDRTEVALDPLFDRLAADFAPQAAAHGLALRVVATTALIDSDPLLLERILRNLVANALRYTPAGGVVLGARRRGGAVRIDVVDTGVGIAAADRNRVFDEFVQIGATAPRGGGRGMGLGLAIVRRLCALLDHPLEVVSRPGRGSRFSIMAPRAMLCGAPAEARPTQPAALPAAQVAGFRGRRIVVVDDDPAVVAAMHALFTSWGADVVGGEDALSALAALGHPPADLIVADLRLADGGSGIEAIEQLRAVLGSATPALVVSGDTSEGARAEALAAGIRLLSKPVIASALKAAAESAMRALEREAARKVRTSGCDRGESLLRPKTPHPEFR
jgi:signal transduction histidine kinase/FixJ family two-component response regulator